MKTTETRFKGMCIAAMFLAAVMLAAMPVRAEESQAAESNEICDEQAASSVFAFNIGGTDVAIYCRLPTPYVQADAYVLEPGTTVAGENIVFSLLLGLSRFNAQ